MNEDDFRAKLRGFSDNLQEVTTERLNGLKGQTDPISLILRGHLIAEDLLLTGIKIHCSNPTKLEEARLSFVQRVALFRALERLPVADDIWHCVLKLNRLRNHLAHDIDQKEMAKLAEGFVRSIEEFSETDRAFPEPKGSVEALAQALHFLLGALQVLVQWHHGVDLLVENKISE